MDLLWIIENQRSENPEMNTSEKMFKLTNQMISKSLYWYINRKLTIRGFQKDQNCQISIYILKLIDPASQCPNSDWKWIVVGQTLNWGGQMIIEFYEFVIHRKLMKHGIHWNQNQVIKS